MSINYNEKITTSTEYGTFKSDRRYSLVLPRTNAPYVRTDQKIGRNDPCPCRSGRKYKKCHGG